MVLVESIADYRIVRSLRADGGPGLVVAERPSRVHFDDDLVAVKVFDGGHDDDARRSFVKGLQVAAGISAPQMMPLLDAGQDGHLLFYAMPLCRRGSLGAPVGPLTEADIVEAVIDAAEAAHALHEAGHAHQAIKPHNILLRPRGAWLSDFGLARSLDETQTVTRAPSIETLEFLDPEVVNGDVRPSRATDVWSLGATLHFTLCGVGLYGELPGQPVAMMRRFLASSPAVSASVPARYRAVIETAFAADRRRRFSTAKAFADALRSVG